MKRTLGSGDQGLGSPVGGRETHMVHRSSMRSCRKDNIMGKELHFKYIIHIDYMFICVYRSQTHGAFKNPLKLNHPVKNKYG